MKRPSRRSPYLVVAGALSILLGLTGAWSQTARTVKIVVPYPAGGTADILARILGEQISRTEGVTLLTENRPGASAVIGTEAVSRAAPDGIACPDHQYVRRHARQFGRCHASSRDVRITKRRFKRSIIALVLRTGSPNGIYRTSAPLTPLLFSQTRSPSPISRFRQR